MPADTEPFPTRWAETDPPPEAAVSAGFRFGARGTHSSRTLMLADLTELLAAVPPDAARAAYAEAIVEENVLGKATHATRLHARQRLRELYALDPVVPLFRIFRRLWDLDVTGRRLLALLIALARDPLLRSTAPAVLPLPEGAPLYRAALRDALRDATGDRLNDAILDKAARHTGSSWTQSGHLRSRNPKVRHRAAATPGALSFAVWLGEREGLGGRDLLRSRWAEVLDRTPTELEELAGEAHRLELLDLQSGGGVFGLRAARLDSP